MGDAIPWMDRAARVETYPQSGANAMRSAVQIDAAGGKFVIVCPFWANELVGNHVPNRRWSKSRKVWEAPVLKMTVRGIRELAKMEGVQITAQAKEALEAYEEKAAMLGARAGGFPSWYPFKTKLRRADGSGVDEYPVYKHSRRVLDKKWGQKAFALHHDMGTAKTRTEIDYACALRMDGKIDAMLVMVKLSGRRNWLEQFNGPMSVGGVLYAEGWAPIPASVYLPYTDDPRGFDRWLSSSHDFKVMVVGLESLSQGRMPEMVERFLLRAGRVYGAIDESHLIANHKSIRSEHVYDFRSLCEYRDTMTGTPISKAPLDLYGQFEWLDPDIIGIGDFYAFRNRYATVIEQKTKSGQKYPLIVGYQNIEELTKLLAPYTDEVRKSDVLELPPKNYLPHVYVQPTKEQAALYKKVKDEGAYLLSESKGEQVVKNVLELGLRLHQIAQGFMPEYEETPYIGRKGDDRIRRVATWHPIVAIERNPKLIELVDIARADRQFIIWASYRAAIDAIIARLQDKYPKDSIVQIHGGISENDRAVWRQEYQAGKHKFMVGNTQTGGTSDTWTACETMIYYDNTERMIDRAQSEDRAHRGGLRHTVDYLDLVMERTVDVTRIKSIGQKMDLAEYVRLNIRNAGALLDGQV